jgi:hypothetical protein
VELFTYFGTKGTQKVPIRVNSAFETLSMKSAT